VFQAVSRSTHFRDLKVYYFHNCIYDKLYTTPKCRRGDWIDTEWVLSNLDSEYKVIFVGDAAMAPHELFTKGGNVEIGLYNREPGIDWLRKFKRRYKKLVWLNPIREEKWPYAYGNSTIMSVKEEFPMYELTIYGLESAIKKLLTR